MGTTEKDGGISGILVVEKSGRIAVSLGVGADPRIEALVSSPEWLEDAVQKRMFPITLRDSRLIAIVRQVGQGHLVILSENPTETVLNFILNVDFAYDIVDHILSDPYDGMAIIDKDAKVAFVSPVHEKFFGLRPGEAIGKNVRDVIENTRLHQVIRTGVAEVGQIQRMNGTERVVSRHPIRHGNKIVGAIGRVMFKGPQQVEAMARRISSLEEQIAQIEKEAKKTPAARSEEFLDAIIGQSFAIQSLREQIRKIAPLDIPVLIQGESGTGKELVAQALHMHSPRQGARLVTVNAAALPESLVESELFGYAPGSFTGADKKGRAGKFEMANRGTIFLDEIGDMPLEVQSKLLRVLQDRIVERVGGDKPKQVDFRLCTATNRDLEEFVEMGKFRLDLYYRISPVTILLPTLEERLEDIPLLLNHFVGELTKQYNRPPTEIETDLAGYLMEQSWPGNIRQLRHAIERAFVFAENGKLGIADFQRETAKAPMRPQAAPPRAASAESDTSAYQGTLKASLEDLENRLINDAIVRFKGNKKKAAEHLGVSRSFLYKKLESS